MYMICTHRSSLYCSNPQKKPPLPNYPPLNKGKKPAHEKKPPTCQIIPHNQEKTEKSEKSTFRYHQQRHPPVSHLSGPVDFGYILKCLSYLLKHLIALVLVQHLPASEQYRKLHLVPLFHKFPGVLEFNGHIVRIGFRAKPDFLHCRRMRNTFFTALAKLALLFIKPFTIIHYPANRRLSIRRNLHKVKPNLFGLANRFISLDNTYLLILFVNQPDLPGSDCSIYL